MDLDSNNKISAGPFFLNPPLRNHLQQFKFIACFYKIFNLLKSITTFASWCWKLNLKTKLLFHTGNY